MKKSVMVASLVCMVIFVCGMAAIPVVDAHVRKGDWILKKANVPATIAACEVGTEPGKQDAHLDMITLEGVDLYIPVKISEIRRDNRVDLNDQEYFGFSVDVLFDAYHEGKFPQYKELPASLKRDRDTIIWVPADCVTT